MYEPRIWDAQCRHTCAFPRASDADHPFNLMDHGAGIREADAAATTMNLNDRAGAIIGSLARPVPLQFE